MAAIRGNLAPAVRSWLLSGVAARGQQRLGIGAVVALCALPVVVHVFAFRDAIIDDAFIQLQYGHQLAASGTWGMLPDRLANTSTSTLNVFLLALADLLPGSLRDAALFLAAAELLAMLALLLRLSLRLFGSYGFGLAAFAAVVFNPLLLSTLGLETVPFFTLMLASVLLFLEGRHLLMSTALAFLTLTRPDGVLLAAILLPQAPAGQRWRCLALYVALLLPWHLYAWTQLGSPLPDTLFIKLTRDAWGGEHFFRNGLGLYLERFPLPTIASFLLAPFALYALRRAAPPLVRALATTLLLYAALHYVAYSLAGVPPFHWYYLHEALPLAVAGAAGLSLLARDRGLAALQPLAWGLPLLVFFVIAAGSGWPFHEAPIHTNWATTRQYREVGRWLAENVPPGAPVLVRGEIGTLAYYSQRTLVNEFSDFNLATRIMDDSASAGVLRPLLDVMSAWRPVLPPLQCPAYVIEQTTGDDAGVLSEGFGARHGGTLLADWPAATKWMPRAHVYVWRLAPDALAADASLDCAP